MNVTEQTMQNIKDQYYWIGQYVFRKDVVHMLIILIAIIIFVCIVIWYSKEKNIK